MRDTCTQPNGKAPLTRLKIGDLPWKKNAQLTVHTMDASTTATMFLFQMATLVASMNACFGGPYCLSAKDVHTEHKQEGGRGESQV